jgi:hypothetical protein
MFEPQPFTSARKDVSDARQIRPSPSVVMPDTDIRVRLWSHGLVFRRCVEPLPGGTGGKGSN